MEDKKIKLTVQEEDSDIRIDKYLSDNSFLLETDKAISRSYLQKIIKNGLVKVNDKIVKPSFLVKEDDLVTIILPKPKELVIKEENIPLDIVYEDDDIIIVNKPKEMVVHPAPGHMEGTLVNALMYHCKDSLSGINGILRPGIVHRIDKDTTGIIVVCKNDKAHMCISEQLKEHSITRKYHAIVHNRFKEEKGTIDKCIARNPYDRKKMAIVNGGKEAVTHYKVLKNLKGNYSYIECELETGRTHQIRVHMASINHSLYGDEVYGHKDSKKTCGQVLHAKVLGFVHPTTKEYVEFEVPLPDYFEKLLNIL